MSQQPYSISKLDHTMTRGGFSPGVSNAAKGAWRVCWGVRRRMRFAEIGVRKYVHLCSKSPKKCIKSQNSSILAFFGTPFMVHLYWYTYFGTPIPKKMLLVKIGGNRCTKYSYWKCGLFMQRCTYFRTPI